MRAAIAAVLFWIGCKVRLARLWTMMLTLLMRAVKPRIAIISAGEDNPFGHPAPQLLERLEASGARILRTDRDGAVHLLTDGKGVEISCFVECVELPW